MTKQDRSLEQRTFEFSRNIIGLCKAIKRDIIVSKIIDQLIRAGTSIGANYMEAINASSKKDFKNKIFICKKESQETKYWLAILLECDDSHKDKIFELSRECHEFNLIFQKIVTTLKKQEFENDK